MLGSEPAEESLPQLESSTLRGYREGLGYSSA
jgi:hypothetical protein